MTKAAEKLNDLWARMQDFPFGSIPLESVQSENKQIGAWLGAFDPIHLATTFGGLLTVPELQSNCIRLEVLVHLGLALGQGRRKPNERLAARLFSELGKGTTGHLEDPAEDVFVSSIATPRGNFRILNGVWESAGFYVQRVVNALDSVPPGGRFDHMRESVYELLKLSDLVCGRAGVLRNQLGNPTPEPVLPRKARASLHALRRIVKFTESDLAAHGISVPHLAEFGFDPSTRAALTKETVGCSSLERYPVTYRNGEYYFLLPTAASTAIRRFIIEEMDCLGLRETFARTLSFEYARLFSETPLCGEHGGALLKFHRTATGLLCGIMTNADVGLYVNFIFFCDTLEGFGEGGLLGVFPEKNADKLAADIDCWIDHAYEKARMEPDFRECMTLLIGCGIGRAIHDVTSNKKRENWRHEFIGASDLLTLSWLPNFNTLSLWRLLEGQFRLKTLGVQLYNVNGLLNIVGWARSLGGHLVPHGNLPDEFGDRTAPSIVLIQQNALRHVRHDAASRWDPHAVRDIEGNWVRVRRDETSLFEEDRNCPFFVAEERGRSKWPHGVYESSARAWWSALETPENTPGHCAFERFKMLKTWLCRMVPILEAALPDLPKGALLLRAKFEGLLSDRKPIVNDKGMTFDEALQTLSVEIDPASPTVTLMASGAFEDALFHPENIAERALVARSIGGFAQLSAAGLSAARQDALVQEIAGDPSARQTHAFMARNFRDFVRQSVWQSPVTIDADDVAAIKLGLGWQVRSRALGGDVRGREECTRLLNGIVGILEDEVCADLRQMNRRAVLMFALMNHEAANCDRDNWRRTAAAVLALHEDKEATLRAIAEHEAKLNAVFQCSRLITEFALCECPGAGGRKPSRLDMSRIMAKLMIITGMGGWSDAIHWQAMEPRVRVTPLGDIHANIAFHEEVIAPYGRMGTDLSVHEAVENYADNLKVPLPKPTDPDAFPPAFWEAFEEQFGASLDDVRRFMDYVEDLGIEAERAILVVKRSKLLDANLDSWSPDPVRLRALVDFLTFRSRPRWRDVPEGYTEKDRFPWRFRRRLSVLRKPLIQIDDADDPTILVAPGMLRDAVVYMLHNYHNGDYPAWQLSPKMHTWAGHYRDRLGKEFTQCVARRLGELGWKTDTDVAVTKLLGKGFDQDYGDVDVLAWRADSGRVLLIECKDVQHKKADGEIAEQLTDFRGELKPNGKPDLLLRHIRRLEVISQHKSELRTYTGLDIMPMMEGHLVFRNPVPMKFVWDRMKDRVALSLMSELHNI